MVDGNRLPDGLELLEQALAAFHEATGLRLKLDRPGQLDATGRRVDAVLRLPDHELEKGLVAEIRLRINNAVVATIRDRFADAAHLTCLVTTYVNPNMAERLRAQDRAFIDTVGNAYLNVPPVYVFVKGKRPPRDMRIPKPNRAFQTTGLKVVFALLCRPGLAEAPYREIAQLTDVALGTIARVIHDLKRLDFVVDVQEGRRYLRNRRELLDRWVAAYPEQLRPRLMIGRFRAARPDWWKTAAPLERGTAYWGGETAAALLTRHLRPELVTVYCREAPQEVQLKNQLHRDPNGETELLRTFWDRALDYENRQLVPPLLTYADLLGTGDPRNVETAKLLYEQEIAGPLGND
ncbi:MAG: type IV toxin-antitoxin system AbiEi family antitoxin [Acidobacteriota bacterium]